MFLSIFISCILLFLNSKKLMKTSSEGEQGQDSCVLCARCEIPWLLLLCNERQMPTHGTPKSQIQDESQTQGVDFPKQWLGICQEEAKT